MSSSLTGSFQLPRAAQVEPQGHELGLGGLEAPRAAHPVPALKATALSGPHLYPGPHSIYSQVFPICCVQLLVS